MTINRVILVGNLGNDPEIRITPEGKEIATFSLATSENWRDTSTGERKERTEWHRVIVFSQGLVGIVKSYVKKGTKLYLEGSLQTRKWTDKQGVEKYTTEVALNNSTLHILDSKNTDTHWQEKAEDKSWKDALPSNKEKAEVDDEIPF